MSKAKKIITVVMLFVFIVAAILVVVLLTKKDKLTEIERVEIALDATIDREDSIIKSYSQSTSNSSSLSSNGVQTQANNDKYTIDNYFNVVLYENYYSTQVAYFMANSSKSNSFANKFELNKTYTLVDGTKTYLFSMATRKDNQNLIDIDYAMIIGENLIKRTRSTINYDFKEEKLLSVSSFVNMKDTSSKEGAIELSYLNYETNVVNFAHLGYKNYDTIEDDLFNNNLKYSTYLDKMDGKSYSWNANITKSVMNIEVVESNISDATGETQFERILNAFVLPHHFSLIDTSNALANTAFVKAMDFANNKLGMTIVENNSRFYLLSSWVEYNEAINLCEALAKTIQDYNDTNKQVLVDLLNNLKQKIVENGVYSYSGEMKYSFNSASVEMSKCVDVDSNGNYVNNRYLCKFDGITTMSESTLDMYFTYENGVAVIELN